MEQQLQAGHENADNNYQGNLDAYDQEMREKHEKIAQAKKEHEEYASQLEGLQEEHRQRLDEKRKRDLVKTMVKKMQEQVDKKDDQENRAAEWIQAHWLGMLERKAAEKARKKGRKGKKGKK